MQRAGSWVVGFALLLLTVFAAASPGEVSAQITLALPDPPTAREWYTPLVPARLLDTRPGMPTIDGLGGGTGLPLAGGSDLGVRVLGRGGVPLTGVTAVVLNVTVTNPTQPSFLTVWPAGDPRPNAANLNFVARQTVPNLVVAKVGANGTVQIYNHAGTVDVVADVAGYVPATDGFVPLSPGRLLDTRPGFATIDGLGRPGVPVGPAGRLDLAVLGRGGVPASGVDAVVLNVAVTNVTASSFITVFPAGSPRPTAANLNMVRGQTVPNLVVAKLGASGLVSIYNHAGSTDVIADVAGYFATGGTYVALTPQRIYETRPGEPVPADAVNRGSRLPANQTVAVDVTGRAGVPDFGVSAVVLNVTAIEPTGPSFLTVYPAGTARPIAANLNMSGNEIVPNLVVAKVGADGKINIYNHASATDLVIDVAGYFEAETGAIRDVDASGQSTCALFEVGTLWCWGSTPQDPHDFGGSLVGPRPEPYEVNVVDDAVDLAVGSEHTCVVRAGGAVWCWSGSTSFNLAGTGSPAEWAGAWPPVPVALPAAAVDVDTNSYQTCALLVDGTVWCWGRDYVGTARPAPWRVGNLDGVTQISLGSYSACALRGDGTVRCWGMRDQFDDSGLDSPTVAVPVTSIAGADSVATPVNAGCVTLEVGSAQCWGNGYFGIDGWPIWDGAGSAIDDVVQVGGGALYTCVLRSDATMYCGDRGPLLGAPVDGLAPVAFFVAADFHVCAVTWNSELYCWGVNGNGQLGDGTLIDSAAPELIVSY